MNPKPFRPEDLSPACLLRFLAKNLWMIAASAVIFALSIGIYAQLLHVPQYRATMTWALVCENTASQRSAAATATDALNQVLAGDTAIQRIRDSHPELTYFSGSATAQQVGKTNYIEIWVISDSPEQTFRAAQALQTLLPAMMDYIAADTLEAVTDPDIADQPINEPDFLLLAAFAGIVGAVAMTALLFLIFLRRDTIQTRSGARRQLDGPILAVVQHEGRLHRKSPQPNTLQILAPTTSFQYTEQIRSICSQMAQEAALRESKHFLVAGVGENEGKSTIAANTAAALAMMGYRVALLDCDLRNPSLDRFFEDKYASTLPLNKLLAQPIQPDRLEQCIQRHDTLRLSMLFPAGSDRRSVELISGDAMVQLLDALGSYDFVILDTPPMGYFADAETLAELVDASILVVRQDHTPAGDVNRAIGLLKNAKSRFLGCVLNDMAEPAQPRRKGD